MYASIVYLPHTYYIHQPKDGNAYHMYQVKISTRGISWVSALIEIIIILKWLIDWIEFYSI